MVKRARRSPRYGSASRPHIGQIAQQIGKITYGVMRNGDAKGNFDYVCGCAGQRLCRPAEGIHPASAHCPALRRLRPSRPYLTLRRTIGSIWAKWLPGSKYKAADAPNFERYGPEFDPHTGNGGLEDLDSD